jgi:signal transduction histidine kinase
MLLALSFLKSLVASLRMKLESGNAEVLIKNINLQETLNAVVHLIKTSQVTEEKKLNIMTIYEPTLPEFICTDNRRIQQILYNLLGNAIKLSKEQGKVEFGVHIADSVISFSVKDYGKGIDQKDFSKIFEPFRQTGTGLTNAKGGTSLGLAITKKLVEALGAQILVVSDVGSWTKFTVDFVSWQTSQNRRPWHKSWYQSERFEI